MMINTLIVYLVLAISGTVAFAFDQYTPLGDPFLFWLIGAAGGVISMAAVILIQDLQPRNPKRVI